VTQRRFSFLTLRAKRYLQITDEHFADALQTIDKAAQNPAQLAHASARQTSQVDSTAHEKTPVLQGRAFKCEHLHERQAPRAKPCT
jgi:hypothetical protein